MKQNCIIVRTSEITLKSKFVRRSLEKKLKQNIRKGLKTKKIKGKVESRKGRIIVETGDIEKASHVLKHVFGIVSFSSCIRMKLDKLYSFMEENAKKLIKGGTFAVITNRVGDHPFTSQDLAKDIGEIIVKKTKKKVDLKHPESEIFVEVRHDDAYVYTEKIKGHGGIPVGSQGKVVCFVNGKDGIIAAWLMMKRGCDPIVCHTVDVDVLDKWSYGIKLKKIKVRSLEEAKKIAEERNMMLVIPYRLQKTSLGRLKKNIERFKHQILLPVIAFTDDEIKKKFEELVK